MGMPCLCIPGNVMGRAERGRKIIYSCKSNYRELVWSSWQAAGCAGTGTQQWDGGLGAHGGMEGKADPQPTGWLHSVGKAGIVTAHPCLFHFSTALSSSPQHPIARLPLEPGKSPSLLYCPLGPEICSAHRFCFPDQFSAFHIDCCRFSHSVCWWIWDFYC